MIDMSVVGWGEQIEPQLNFWAIIGVTIFVFVFIFIPAMYRFIVWGY